MTRHGSTRILAAIATTLALAGCSSAPTPVPAPSPSSSASSVPTAPTTTPTVPVATPPKATGAAKVIAKNLTTPWSIVRLASGSTLISERDTALVKELTAGGALRTVGKVPGVVHVNEGGLLGLAVSPGNEATLYAYTTTASDNRIVRMPLEGSPGSYSLGAESVIVKGFAKAGNHNGGRIEFGPDGMLYATVGDAGGPPRAQDLGSLNGKILRMTPDGKVPAGNPFATLVWSYGHRNPQGLAWDSTGQLYASEFGQDTWDEFNRIIAGKNYGWPTVEGISNDSKFVNPLYEWPTDDASPSGLAYVNGTFFLASLRGTRLWEVFPTGMPVAFAVGSYGRMRDVVPGPGNTIWVLTSNTDSRGNPAVDDDKLLQFSLTPH